MPDNLSPGEINVSAERVEALESMFPDIYHCVHPIVRRMCEMHDIPTNPYMYPSPSRAVVEQMADQIYNTVTINYGIRDDDVQPMQRQFVGPGFVGPGFVGPGFVGPFFRRRFLRDLIAILLIRELLFRRGRFF
ncbi:MAG: hypothetical protein A4E52_00593 [Pelotomaculum sp. PtaB.Bin013]|uniref:Uncharacterized protein n=1 Tax=Pelotomaculum isophthalicicum JI TaxID=947010 RepID=A0A9X4JU56_9FIRM|nr:hypothetical protein [Pelotomaculum isophthalicicum]MDF9409939.1 hypothetical protein [Pelotomaculum isophthalicicum JI]OPX91108.1 MAG: hypothetical protein A4E52_00593 [Pelotomaculum sp. PtaB.Bin013]